MPAPTATIIDTRCPPFSKVPLTPVHQQWFSFRDHSSSAFNKVRSEFAEATKSVLAASALLQVKNDASYTNWRTFIFTSGIHLSTSNNVAYFERVSNLDRSAFEDSVRQYYSAFSGIWERNPDRQVSGSRPVYYPAKFHSLFSSISEAIYGYDALMDSARVPALQAAIDSSSPAVTGRLVSPITPEDRSVGLFAPVYSTSSAPTSTADRRASNAGVTFSFVYLSSVLNLTGTSYGEDLGLYLLDNMSANADTALLCTTERPVSFSVSSPSDIPSINNLKEVMEFSFADRVYTLVVVPRRGYTSGSNLVNYILPVALAVLSLCVILSWLLISSKRNRLEALNLSKVNGTRKRLAMKRQSEKMLRAERKLLREEVECRTRAEEAAKQAIRDRSTFFAKMSHEIRTPMHAILALIQILKNDQQISRSQKQLLSTMEDSSELLLSVVSDILDFTKAENKMLEFHLQPVDLRSTICKCVALFSERAASAQKQLIFCNFGESIAYTDALEDFCASQVSGNCLSGGPVVCLSQLLLHRGSTEGEAAAGPSFTSLKGETLLASDIPLPFMLDATKMRQVLYNLLSNAVKYCRKIVRLSWVVVQLTAVDFVCHLELADDGRGIQPSEHGRIFKSFVQIENQEGTGLGLAVVSEIVKAMGGTIFVRSQKGYGATFVVDFPMKLSSTATGLSRMLKASCRYVGGGAVGDVAGKLSDAPTLRASKSAVFEAPFRGKSVRPGKSFSFSGGISLERLCAPIPILSTGFSKSVSSRPTPRRQQDEGPSSLSRHWKVLVVDDNRINQRVLQSMLQSLLRENCVGVDTAVNGKQALDLFVEAARSSSWFHLVLMDCQMPVMDGLEATRRIREFEDQFLSSHPEDFQSGSRLCTPIVAITANALPEQVEECFSCGMQDVLVKPFGKAQVSEVLATYLHPEVLKP